MPENQNNDVEKRIAALVERAAQADRDLAALKEEVRNIEKDNLKERIAAVKAAQAARDLKTLEQAVNDLPSNYYLDHLMGSIFEGTVCKLDSHYYRDSQGQIRRKTCG